MEFRLQAKHKILKGDRTESLAVSEGQQVWGADCSALLRVTEVCSLTSINPSLAMFLLSSPLWITLGWGRGGNGWGGGGGGWVGEMLTLTSRGTWNPHRYCLGVEGRCRMPGGLCARFVLESWRACETLREDI